MPIKNIKKYNNRGFTILEVVISFMIIAMGMVGVLALIVQNIRTQYIDRNVLMAAQLAQEGMEIARSVRDENWLTTGSAFNTDLGVSGSRQFIIDYRGRSSLTDVSGINDSLANLKISAGGLYWHGAGTATNFNRIINTQTFSGSYLDVRSTVSWKEGSQSHSYVVEAYLYDWK